MLVKNVGMLANRNPTIVSPLFSSIRRIVEEGKRAIKEGNLSLLGELMDINHGILNAIGVGHPLLDKYVWIARKAGALGAKLTGAGGGGCMIALAEDRSHAIEIKEALQEQGAEALTSSLTNKGVSPCNK